MKWDFIFVSNGISTRTALYVFITLPRMPDLEIHKDLYSTLGRYYHDFSFQSCVFDFLW